MNDKISRSLSFTTGNGFGTSCSPVTSGTACSAAVVTSFTGVIVSMEINYVKYCPPLITINWAQRGRKWSNCSQQRGGLKRPAIQFSYNASSY